MSIDLYNLIFSAACTVHDREKGNASEVRIIENIIDECISLYHKD